MEEPEITKTKAGQFGVRWGDTYEVFVTEEQAVAFRQKLMNTKTPPPKSAKKAPLQTLPPDGPPFDIFGGPPAPDNAFTQTLLGVLKATRPQDMPKDLLKRVLDYTYSNKGIALSVIEGSFGQSFAWNGGTATAKMDEIRKDLGNYLDGYNRLSADAAKFIKEFVDLVEIPSPAPAPKSGLKAEVAPSATPHVSPEPAPPRSVVDKTARKKRTIRRSQD